MKSVSNAYKSGIHGLLRNRFYTRITFENMDITVATDGEQTNNGELLFSESEIVNYPHQYGSPYAVSELNRRALDGKVLIPPGSGVMQDGFVSSHMNDVEEASNTPAAIIRQLPTPYAFLGLTLASDTWYQEWSSQITTRFYPGSALADTQIIPVTGAEAVVNTGVAQVGKVMITFDMALSHRRSRLGEALCGLNKQFVNKDIISTQQKHGVDPLSHRLSTGTVEFIIIDYEHNYDPDNPIGIYIYVDENSPTEIQFSYELSDGSMEWIKSDEYVLNDKSITKDNQTTFTGTDLIGSLTETFYKSKLDSRGLFAMAGEVLLDAGLTLAGQGTHPREIDESLRQVLTMAALPIDTYMSCLRSTACAVRCRLFADDGNIIHVKPFGVTVTDTYSGQRINNGHLRYSEWGTVDKGSTNGNTYVAFELNHWTPDGDNQMIIPGDNPDRRGYTSEAMTNAEGILTTTPAFTRTFDISYGLLVATIRFGTPMDKYSTPIQVKYHRDIALLDIQTVSVSFIEVFMSSPLAIDCIKIEVSFLSGPPYRRMRVSKAYYRETDSTLGFSSTTENSQMISKIDELKAAIVARYSCAASDSTTDLYEEATTETELHVEFFGPAQDIQINVSGGTLISSNIYAGAVDLVLSSGIKAVTITGQILQENSVVASYPVVLTGEVDREENLLITNDSMCLALANHVRNHLQMRNTHDTDYRGNLETDCPLYTFPSP